MPRTWPPIFSQSVLATFRSPVSRVWVRRVLTWVLVGYVFRYVYYGNFLTGTSSALWVLSLVLLVQTMTLYYVFAYTIFPKTLYEGRLLAFLGWLLLWNGLIYQSNYWLFYWLRDSDGNEWIIRYWKRLDSWGLLGFITSSAGTFWSFFWSFPLASIMLTIKAVSDLLRLRTQTIQLEKDKLALELDFLKAQVNPHFLFNTLNSVYARVFDIDEQAGDLLLGLSELMRYNLYETNQPRVDLAKELAYIQNYIDLERNRLDGQHIQVSFTQSGESELHQIAPLLLIAFVENAFKHSVKGGANTAFIRVKAETFYDQFFFTVENSVPVNRKVINDPVKKSGGVGLNNVRRRLKTIYPNQHTLTVNADKAVYAVQLVIQL